ncbi:MAG: hypothetical protein M3066_03830 [Actinomycetota bacterium]|nr:hypothetical protein [Actinomycetota bacterium]
MTDPTTYHDLIDAADASYRQGHFKEAHIAYGNAVACGGPRDDYCRHMRGICSRRVAEQRLQKAVDRPEERRPFLNQAARWLAKSEANLDSAFDESPGAQRGHIRLEQAQTEELMARFVEMSGGNPERRLAAARRYREEGLELLNQA